jgi:hypothetical protein
MIHTQRTMRNTCQLVVLVVCLFWSALAAAILDPRSGFDPGGHMGASCPLALHSTLLREGMMYLSRRILSTHIP